LDLLLIFVYSPPTAYPYDSYPASVPTGQPYIPPTVGGAVRAVAAAVVHQLFPDLPNMWNRHSYNYGGHYSRHHPFMPPAGVAPHVGNLFIQASQIFRSVDTNCSGHLNKREWKHAMKMLGITFSRHEARQLFRMADTNHSGRLSEREFAEFWVWLNHHRYPQQYPTLY